MTTMRAAFLSFALLLVLVVPMDADAQTEPSPDTPGAPPPQEVRRPAGGLLSHSFSDVVEDNFGLAPQSPEASPEQRAQKKYDPALPAPGRLPR